MASVKETLVLPITTAANGYALNEDDAKKVELFNQEAIDAEIARQLEKKKVLDAYAAGADMREAARAMKNMASALKTMPEKVKDMSTKLAALREQYAESMTPNDGVERNYEPIEVREFLRSLRVLKTSTDETIEMAPGVHAHSIDLVIAMIVGRR